MPGAFQTSAIGGVPSTKGMPVVRTLRDNQAAPFEYPFAIAGTTLDANGDPLPNCDVTLFRTADDSIAAQGTSDDSGNYALGASPTLTHYLVAYLPGTPDVAGTTVNTLVGS